MALNPKTIYKNYMIARKPIRNYVLANEVYVKAVVEYDTKEVLSDLAISLIEDEIMISDKLVRQHGTIVYDFAEGMQKEVSKAKRTRPTARNIILEKSSSSRYI